MSSKYSRLFVALCLVATGISIDLRDMQARAAATDVTVQKSISTWGAFFPGSMIDYEIIVFAYPDGPFGGGSASQVVLTEVVPANTVFVANEYAWSCPDASPAGATCVLNLGTVNHSSFLRFRVRVNDVVPVAQSRITNTVQVGSPDDGNPGNNSTSFGVDIDLSKVAISVDRQIADVDANGALDAGEQITYTASVTNIGLDPSSNLVIELEAMQLVKFQQGSARSSTGSPSVANGSGGQDTRVFVHMSSLAAGEAATLTVVGQLNQIINSATDVYHRGRVVSGFGQLLTETALIPTAITRRPDLDLYVSDVAYPTGIGSLGPIVITGFVHNNGPYSSTNTVLTAALPAYARLDAAASMAGWNCLSDICSIQLGVLGPSESPAISRSRDVTLTLVPSPSVPSNVITGAVGLRVDAVGSAPAERNLANNASTHTIFLGQRAQISITKQVGFALDANGDGKVGVGDVLSYTVTLTNNSAFTASSVLLDDQLPAGASCYFYECFGGALEVLTPTASASHGSLTATNTMVQLTLDDIAPSSAVTLTFSVSLRHELPLAVPSIDNRAFVTDVFGLQMSSNLVSSVIERVQDAQISKHMQLGVNAAPLYSGDLVTFTIVATSTGSQALQNVVIDDTEVGNHSGNHTGFVILTNTITSSQGAIETFPGKPGDVQFAVGTLAPGKTFTASFRARAAHFLARDDRLANQALVRWGDGVGPAPLTRESNVVSATVRLGPDLFVDGDWQTPNLTQTLANTRLISIWFRQQWLNIPAVSGVVITQTVPMSTTFNAVDSAAGWNCPDGGVPNSLCVYQWGNWATYSASVPITFAVTLQTGIPTQTLRLASMTTIADDGSRGRDENLGNNVLNSSIWLRSPEISQTATIMDVNHNDALDQNERVILVTRITNTLDVALPFGMHFSQHLDYRLSYVWNTGVLTAPDGVFPAGPISGPTGCSYSPFASGRIDAEIPPGTVVQMSFHALRNSYAVSTPLEAHNYVSTLLCDENTQNVVREEFVAVTYVDPLRRAMLPAVSR